MCPTSLLLEPALPWGLGCYEKLLKMIENDWKHYKPMKDETSIMKDLKNLKNTESGHGLGPGGSSTDGATESASDLRCASAGSIGSWDDWNLKSPRWFWVQRSFYYSIMFYPVLAWCSCSFSLFRKLFSPTAWKAWDSSNKASGWFGAAARNLAPGSPRFHIKS